MGVFFFDGYHMRDDDGTYSGYGIELLNLISQYSHLNFEFTGYDNAWAETQSMLLNGEIDVATSARKTRERTEIYLYSTPISLNNTVLTVWKGNTSIVSGDYSTYDGMTVGRTVGRKQSEPLPARFRSGKRQAQADVVRSKRILVVDDIDVYDSTGAG